MTFLGTLFLSVYAAFSILGQHSNVVVKTVSSKRTSNPTARTKMITAQGDISEHGQTIHLAVLFPEDGGNVSGTVSGDCTGKIHGTYSGNNGKNLTGVVSADCSILLMNISGTATFNGVVNAVNTEAQVQYSANFANSTKSGASTFTLSEE